MIILIELEFVCTFVLQVRVLLVTKQSMDSLKIVTS